MDNDANAAALGEVLAGAAKDFRDAVLITVGTGVGFGIVLDKKLYKGINGAAGELGHEVIVVDGLPCNCGRRGCLELYASATALKRSRPGDEKAPKPYVLSSSRQHSGRVDAKRDERRVRARWIRL